MQSSKRTGIHRAVERLDGTWFCLTDPTNAGRDRRWFAQVPDEAHPAPVPGTIQQVFPDHRGVAWYWCEVIPVRNPHPDGRYLLRCGAVDYRGEVWFNAERISTHDGGETPFVLDVTDSVRPGERNLIAIRVVCPTDEPIDGLTLRQTAHGLKKSTTTPRAILNSGGVIGSVELLCRPSTYVAELVARPNSASISLNILSLVLNTLETIVQASLRFAVAPAAGGETLQAGNAVRPLQPGQTLFETQLPLPEVEYWSPAEPFLYRLTAKLLPDGGGRGDEVSTRFGFRDFRMHNGHFRMNGTRFFWKGVRTSNDYPIGRATPPDPAMTRRELSLVKALGFNSIRTRAAMARPAQLDACDELGLCVYQESHAASGVAPSPTASEEFDRAVREMILRDRNHPCVVIWGLLSDVEEGASFKHGVESLPMASFLDDSRMIFLNSGRLDRRSDVGALCNTGCADWESLLPVHPDNPAGAGDIHLTLSLPLCAQETERLRSLGLAEDAPVFVSDTFIQGSIDLLGLMRKFEQMSRTDVPDAKLAAASLDRFLRDWRAWDMADVFGRPEDFFDAMAKQKGERLGHCLKVLRSNAHIIGVTVGLADDSASGIGVLSAFREGQPAVAAAVCEALRPLGFCLFAEPSAALPGTTVRFETVLAHEDVLHPGEYSIVVQLFDPEQRVVFEKRTKLEIPASEFPLALPLVAQNIEMLDVPGEYRLTASFENGAWATASEAVCVVLPALPSVRPPITLWAEDHLLANWLMRHNIPYRMADASARGPAQGIILVTRVSPRMSVRQSFQYLSSRASDGATVIFLDPKFFHSGDAANDYLPVGDVARVRSIRSGADSLEFWARRHAIFDGIHESGLLDDRIFREMLPTLGYSDVEATARVVSAAHRCGMHPDDSPSGVTMCVFEPGDGRIILNSFPIVANLEKIPAAERMLLNLLAFSATP